MTETVLESLDIDPPPSEADIGKRVDETRLALIERVHGIVPLHEAAQAEGIAETEMLRLLRRQALASLYLDRMVTPMLEPTEGELRAAYARKDTPFRELPYVQARPLLQRWYTARKLGAAVQAYYQNARGRLNLVLLGELPGSD